MITKFENFNTEEKHQLTDIGDIKKFILAGKATFTLESTRTGKWFTFNVKRKDFKNRETGKVEKTFYFVSVLRGPQNTSDFTYVANVVEANLLACKVKKLNGEVINIACGKAYSLLDLVDELNKILGVKIKPNFQNERKGDVKHSLADMYKAGSLLGYEPSFAFKMGLELTVEWYR